MHGARQALGLLQPPVAAEAHAQMILLRLDMDVGGAALDGAGDHVGDEADDGRLAGDVLQPLDVVGVAGVGGLRVAVEAGARLGQAIEAGEGRLEVGRRRPRGRSPGR